MYNLPSYGQNRRQGTYDTSQRDQEISDVAARQQHQQEMIKEFGRNHPLTNPILNVDPNRLQNPEAREQYRQAVTAANTAREDLRNTIWQMRNPRPGSGPQIGANPDYLEALVFGGQGQQAASNWAQQLSDNRARYGSSIPTMADRVAVGNRANDALQGIPGISDAAQFTMMSMLPAAGQALRTAPVISQVRSGLERVGNVASRVPGATQANTLAKKLDPTDLGKFTADEGFKTALRGGNPFVKGAVIEQLGTSQAGQNVASLSGWRHAMGVPSHMKWIPLIAGSQ